MTRLMGDATHANVPTLATVPGLQLVAGYDSGSPDIDWTPQDWAQFPGLPQVHIDQAFNTTVNTEAHVTVFDVEPGAYQPSQAGMLIALNTTARPTIYVNQSNIVATVQSASNAPNWRGDTWVAVPGWVEGQFWPPEVQRAVGLGARIVAVQNQLDVANAYDLSIVLDPAWPYVATDSPEDDMRIVYGQAGRVYLLSGGRAHLITTPTDLGIYVGAGIPEVGGPRQGGNLLTTGEETAFLADFPPGNPAVTVTLPTLDISMTGTGTITHA